MVAELLRFYRSAPRDLPTLGDESLEAYLDRRRFGRAFRDDHLYPMAAAIWSTPAAKVGEYPAAAFIRFCDNHGLLRLTGRPVWRTVIGGSREYVRRLTARRSPAASSKARPCGRSCATAAASRSSTRAGERRRFDHVVVATHADQALRLLAAPTERRAAPARRLPLFRQRGRAARRRRPDAASAAPPGRAGTISPTPMAPDRRLSVTYWMNRLQPLRRRARTVRDAQPVARIRAPSAVHGRFVYEHPLFDAAAARAQRELWSLQGVRQHLVLRRAFRRRLP